MHMPSRSVVSLRTGAIAVLLMAGIASCGSTESTDVADLASSGSAPATTSDSLADEDAPLDAATCETRTVSVEALGDADDRAWRSIGMGVRVTEPTLPDTEQLETGRHLALSVDDGWVLLDAPLRPEPEVGPDGVATEPQIDEWVEIDEFNAGLVPMMAAHFDPTTLEATAVVEVADGCRLVAVSHRSDGGALLTACNASDDAHAHQVDADGNWTGNGDPEPGSCSEDAVPDPGWVAENHYLASEFDDLALVAEHRIDPSTGLSLHRNGGSELWSTTVDWPGQTGTTWSDSEVLWVQVWGPKPYCEPGNCADHAMALLAHDLDDGTLVDQTDWMSASTMTRSAFPASLESFSVDPEGTWYVSAGELHRAPR